MTRRSRPTVTLVGRRIPIRTEGRGTVSETITLVPETIGDLWDERLVRDAATIILPAAPPGCVARRIYRMVPGVPGSENCDLEMPAIPDHFVLLATIRTENGDIDNVPHGHEGRESITLPPFPEKEPPCPR